MNKIKTKFIIRGFSLAEMMIVLAILAIMALAATPLITKKRMAPIQQAPHGQFECYIKTSNGHVYQKYTIENSAQGETDMGVAGTASCTFDPPAKSAYFMVALVGGGASGTNANSPSTTDNGGGAGKLIKSFFPALESGTTMKPGAATITPPTGTTTGITGNATTFNNGDLSADGGSGNVGIMHGVCGTQVLNMCVDIENFLVQPQTAPVLVEYQAFKSYGAIHDWYNGSSANYSSDTWARAVKHCWDKGTGWRLPTGMELDYLYEDATANGNKSNFYTSAGSQYFYAGIDGLTNTKSYSRFFNNTTVSGENTNRNGYSALQGYARCVKTIPGYCDNGFLVKNGANYICVRDKNLSSGSLYVPDQTTYTNLMTTLGKTPYSGDYWSDEWANKLYTCYMEGTPGEWRLPTRAEFTAMSTSNFATYPETLKYNQKNAYIDTIMGGDMVFWTSELQSALYPYYYYNTPKSISYGYPRTNNRYGICVKSFTAPPAGSDTTPNYGQESEFGSYLQFGNYTFSVTGSGNGGGPLAAGFPGAVLIVW